MCKKPGFIIGLIVTRVQLVQLYGKGTNTAKQMQASTSIVGWNRDRKVNCMYDDIMVKISLDNQELVALSTYSRQSKHHGRFLISRNRLLEWTSAADGTTFYDMDIGNVIQIRNSQRGYDILIIWLSENGNNHVAGEKQYITLPYSVWTQSVVCGISQRYLYQSSVLPPKIDVSGAGNTIKHIIGVPAKKRAFSKFLRDHFTRWCNTEYIALYPDGQDSFYFSADGSLNGGVILHSDFRKTKHGNFLNVYYGCHT